MNLECFLNEQLDNILKINSINLDNLLKIIYIHFHSNIENELILSRIILEKIDHNTKIIKESETNLENSYKLLLNHTIQKTFKGAFMP